MEESRWTKLVETVSTGEPAQSPRAKPAVKRVTQKKAKDPKKVAAGRAGAAARQKRLLEQRQAANESLRPGDGTSVSVPDRAAKEHFVRVTARLPVFRTGNADIRPKHNWIPWIKGACLAGGSLVYTLRNMRLRARPTSFAAEPAPKVQDKPPNWKACPDPHYME